MSSSLSVEKREEIETEDLSFLTPRLSKEGYTLEVIPPMIREYRRYLIMRVFHSGELPMYSIPIDDAWHAHILHTAKYRQFCDRIYGYYLDHRPYMRDEFDARLAEYSTKTLALYREIFGEEAPSFWHDF
jgi:hypothetical protein